MIMLTDYQLLRGKVYIEKSKRTFLGKPLDLEKNSGENSRLVQPISPLTKQEKK